VRSARLDRAREWRVEETSPRATREGGRRYPLCENEVGGTHRSSVSHLSPSRGFASFSEMFREPQRIQNKRETLIDFAVSVDRRAAAGRACGTCFDDTRPRFPVRR
jgi:hypothetical protein